ncbi:predicted protein [Histoplasma mississippiense (nom. inval.)]|uniref:predicted protein n=1 Tax=Ajellomyces capsulatus (strain NAm1 / WU24) TaxID=2059318 RepID=UPI000157C479|nr:predicted protein [Histoplasma mississippiense (nom. inval.)]EDN08477.1 predicted protein [Histoplasma mississippiense (nom. inval.)]
MGGEDEGLGGRLVLAASIGWPHRVRYARTATPIESLLSTRQLIIQKFWPASMVYKIPLPTLRVIIVRKYIRLNGIEERSFGFPNPSPPTMTIKITDKKCRANTNKPGKAQAKGRENSNAETRFFRGGKIMRPGNDDQTTSNACWSWCWCF